MPHEIVRYYSDNIEMIGNCYWDDALEHKRRPAVLVVHAWKGQDDFARTKAEELAKMGYAGFAIDVYGDGKTANTTEEAAALMMPLFIDRKQLQQRLIAAYNVIKEHPICDGSRIAVIGFCFGGLCAIELLRSGAAIKGAVSFHGVLTEKINDHKANMQPIAQNIKGSLLVLHGHDDPMVPPSDVLKLENDLTQAKIDWQLNVYGNAMHAFSNPAANDHSLGTVYNKAAAIRSWQSMTLFLNEIFSHP